MPETSPTRLELLFAGFQLAKSDRAIEYAPVRRIARGLRQQRFIVEPPRWNHGRRYSLRDTFAALQQVFIITAKRPATSRGLSGWLIIDNRRVNRRMIAQRKSGVVVGGEHDRVRSAGDYTAPGSADRASPPAGKRDAIIEACLLLRAGPACPANTIGVPDGYPQVEKRHRGSGTDSFITPRQHVIGQIEALAKRCHNFPWYALLAGFSHTSR